MTDPLDAPARGEAEPPASRYLVTPGANFASRSASRHVAPASSMPVGPGDPVHDKALALADSWGLPTLILVGEGDGRPADAPGRVRTIRIRHRSSFAPREEAGSGGHRLACDLTQPIELRRTLAGLQADLPAIIILDRVIERLHDLRPLLSELRWLMQQDERCRLLVSTPDRSRLPAEGPEDLPRDPAAYRRWSLDEAAALFASAGFTVEASGHVPGCDSTDACLELSFSLGRYLAWLRQEGIIGQEVAPSHVFLTSEYADLGPSGELGAVVEQQRRVHGAGQALALYVNSSPIPEPERRALGVLAVEDLFRDEETLTLPIEDRALQAIRQLLFFFPDLSTVQYQDHAGIGVRVAQAARAGLLPERLRTVVHCHGSVHYHENQGRRWTSPALFGMAAREKISVERSDVAVFPSRFMHDLYAEAGIACAHPDKRIIGYPYELPTIEEPAPEAVDTLVFVGEPTAANGFPLFVEALAGDPDRLASAGIGRVVVAAASDSEREDEAQRRLEALAGRIAVEQHLGLGRAELRILLSRHARTSLFVAPYLASSQPLALLDIVAAGGIPLVVDAGGTPEMLPGRAGEELVAPSSPSGLRDRIVHLATATEATRRALLERLREGVIGRQQEIRRALLDLGAPRPGAKRPEELRPLAASVVVPYFNTDLAYLRDLIEGLNGQVLAPEEVIFVDDASEEANVEGLRTLAARELRHPWRVISHPINRGLAAARNTALAACRSAILINLDSDDVPHEAFVRDIVWCLARDREAVVAVPYLEAFEDGADHRRRSSVRYTYRAIGEGLIPAQTENILGHANGGVRVDALRELGGWDGQDRSKYEDWALYLRLVSTGRRIAVIPEAGCLYRLRPLSMVRTYETWPGLKRRARGVEGLPRFDAFHLQALAQDHLGRGHALAEAGAARAEAEAARVEAEAARVEAEAARSALGQALEQNAALLAANDALRGERAALVEERDGLRRQVDRRSVRALNAVEGRLRRHPLIYRLLGATASRLWQAGTVLGRRRDREGS